MMVKVTRYDNQGDVFQTCVSPTPIEIYVDSDNDRLYLSMPLRLWGMFPGGKLEIEAV